MKHITTLSAVLLLYSFIHIHAQPLIEWQKNLGGTKNDHVFGLEPTSDNGCILIGFTESADGDISGSKGRNDIWLVKMAPGGTVQWAKNYGGPGDDYGVGVKQMPDGGYVFTGVTNRSGGDIAGLKGGQDMWLVRVDRDGNILWQRCLGGSGFDAGFSLVVTSDGGLAVTGTTQSNDGDVTSPRGSIDIWIVRLNASGTLLWQRTLGGTNSDDGPHKILETKDGGLILGGSTSSDDRDVTVNRGQFDTWLVRLDRNGTLLWQRTYGGSGNDIFGGIAPAGTGWWVISNTNSTDGDVSAPSGDNDLWLLRINEDGNMLSEKSLGGTAAENNGSLAATADGGCIILGYTTSSDGDVCSIKGSIDLWLVKITASGMMEWQKTFGGFGNDLTIYGQLVSPAGSGGYFFAGLSSSSDGDLTGNKGLNDLWVVKVDDGKRPVPSFGIGYASPVCTSDATASPLPVPGFEPGGTYTATTPGLELDKATGIIRPEASIPGTYTINYQITCPYNYTTSTVISILPPSPEAPFSFSYPVPACGLVSSLPADKSTGFPAGGRFSTIVPGAIVNETTGQADPSRSTPGRYTVVYRRPATSCSPALEATAELVVEPPINLSSSFNYVSEFICSDDSLQSPVTPESFTAGGIFSASSGLYLHATTGAINPRSSLPGTYTVSYNLAITGCYTGTPGSSTNVTIYNCHCSVQVPNAFTPNGDGRNDLFTGLISPDCLLEKYKLTIHNRWGNKVYESGTPADRWNGMYKATPQPVGTYVYKLQIQFRGQPVKLLSGTFLLLR